MVKVVLPDESELELPDGATGLDAARAIGPKLAEQAVLLRSNGAVRDLRLPVSDGERIQILTTRDKDDPDALYVLRHSAAHLLAEAARRLFPGTKVAIGPPIENGFYYDFEFPEPVTEADLQRLEDEVKREISGGPRLGARGDRARRRAQALRAGGGAVQGRAGGHGRGRHLALQAGRLHRPLPRAASPGREADQGGEAPLARRRVLAGRRDEAAADPRLRDGVLRPQGPGGLPPPDRGGEAPRPQEARARTSTCPTSRSSRRAALLASARDGDLECPRGRCASARTRSAATTRCAPRSSTTPTSGDLRPLGEVPGGHVPAGGRGPRLRPQADELPGALPPLFALAAFLP